MPGLNNTEHEARGLSVSIDAITKPWAPDLNNAQLLHDMAVLAARANGATVVGEVRQSYAPQGVTVVIFLEESHIIVTTYPEHGIYFVDVFACGGVDAAIIGKEIVEYIGGEIRSLVVVERGAWITT